MINYNYTTRIDPDDNLEYACYTEGDNYYEVLKIAEESELDLLLKIDAALLLTEMNKLRITQMRDDVYVNAGTLVRQDYTIGQSQGAALVNQLQSAFPDHANWNRSILNIVGSYGAYREPYTNNSISWYDFGTTPSTELCTSYGVTKTADNSSNFKEWYGLKFDLTTNEVWFKCVRIDLPDITMPALPVGPSPFFATTHKIDGTTTDFVDAYVYCTTELMKDFCETHSLNYPMTDAINSSADTIWIWGIVFNKHTQAYTSVKGYARYYLD